MRRLPLLASLLLASCGPARPAEPSPLARLHLHYIYAYATLDPNWATTVGLHDHDDRLTRYDDDSHDARRALVSRTLREIRAIDPAPLDPQDRLDHRLFLAQLRVEEYEFGLRDARTILPDLPLGAVSAVHTLLIKDFASKERRVACAVARLRQVDDVCADARAKLDRPPRLWTQMALDDFDGALAFLDEIPALAGETPGLPEAIAEARAAYTRYRDFLKNELLPRSDGSFAAGRETYDFRLRHELLLPYSAPELIEIGRREFDHTIAMLEETARTIDPSRDWKAILDEMMNDHPTKEKLLDVYRDHVARARRFLLEKNIVGIPQEKLEVIETPPFERSTVPFAAYHPPAPLDDSRLGHFYVTPEPEAHITSDIPGTVWHEAYPGHHLQFVYAKDVPSLVRRLNESPLLSEGWGFYCEELAHETGYYTDPKERLMQLNWRLQRAARVLLDVAIHTGGMTYDEAVEFLVEKVRMRKPGAESSVNAYTRSPTYFPTYMLGMLEIVRIREKFRATLGVRFTLKEFHERLLKCGNVPPALLEEELDRTWR